MHKLSSVKETSSLPHDADGVGVGVSIAHISSLDLIRSRDIKMWCF
jgi:hypothetical protein